MYKCLHIEQSKIVCCKVYSVTIVSIVFHYNGDFHISHYLKQRQLISNQALLIPTKSPKHSPNMIKNRGLQALTTNESQETFAKKKKDCKNNKAELQGNVGVVRKSKSLSPPIQKKKNF